MKENEKYGVASFELCKKLDWQKETLFTYYVEQDGKIKIALTEHFNDSIVNEIDYCYAPQVHEILEELPQYFIKNNVIYFLHVERGSKSYTSFYSLLEARKGTVPAVNETLIESFIYTYLQYKEFLS